MHPFTIVGTSLLFAGCITESVVPVSEGTACEEEGASSCATDTADDAGYVCIEEAWTADPDCQCDAATEEVVCVDTAIGFTGVTRAAARRAGAPRATARRLRIA